MPESSFQHNLTAEEFQAIYRTAEPLAIIILDAIDAYANVHGLYMMTAWMALDMARYCVEADIQETRKEDQ